LASFAPSRQPYRYGRVNEGQGRASVPRLAKNAAWLNAAWLVCVTFLAGCHLQKQDVAPKIEFTRVPPAVEGGSDKLDIIEGRVTGASSGEQLVLYARSGKWWIQPLASEPFTIMRRDSRWTNSTHLGTEYAALLVESGFHPATMLAEVPSRGGNIVAVATIPGSQPQSQVSKTLRFSGYEWRIRNAPSSRGGGNNYDSSNAWTDSSGALHLRIAKSSSDWTSAEVALTRSLGYGSYSFTVRDTSHLEPAAVFGIFTWDYAGARQNNSEMDIEITRWGDRTVKNAQYVVQPFYVAENSSRFALPSGELTHSFDWEPSRVTFKTFRGADGSGKTRPIAEHVFTSGVPAHAAESVRMNLYVFRMTREALHNEAEVVVEKFEYLP
jgi:hypothetical protein